MSEQDEILGAFKASAEKERVKVGGEERASNLNDIEMSSTYADIHGIVPGVFTSANVEQQGLLPGQRIMGMGTTVANPLRSDPRVEAVLGEKRYKEKAPETSPNQMKIEIQRLNNIVETLLKQSGNDAMAATVQDEPKPEHDDDFDEKNLQELKAIAKSVGVKCPPGLTKDEIIRRLRNYKNVG